MSALETELADGVGKTGGGACWRHLVPVGDAEARRWLEAAGPLERLLHSDFDEASAAASPHEEA
jgi:hypothetical protein